jgi:negative regulator of flagellin synthesis FlgM
MSSIKINNLNDAGAINSVGRGDIKRARKSDGEQSVENKGLVESDSVNLSNTAMETGKLVDQLKELPDVRQEKVSEVKNKFSTGSFQPSSGEIADAILKDENS